MMELVIERLLGCAMAKAKSLATVHFMEHQINHFSKATRKRSSKR
jgi:hypothetical protein